MPDGSSRFAKALLGWLPEDIEGKRRRGRCRTRWRDAISRHLAAADIAEEEVETLAADRSKWRSTLALLVSYTAVICVVTQRFFSQTGQFYFDVWCTSNSKGDILACV